VLFRSVGTYCEAGPYAFIRFSATFAAVIIEEQELSRTEPANNPAEPHRKSRRVHL
jgi:hypothetical protein